MSPSVHIFELTGTNGYCAGNHAIIQAEDCFGSAKEVFGDQLEIVLLFNHSSWHAKERSNGFDIKEMNKCWSGKVMGSTEIDEDEFFEHFTIPITQQW
jgi:hypothetical protein